MAAKVSHQLFIPRTRQIPSSIFPISAAEIDPIFSARRDLSIDRICSHLATEPPSIRHSNNRWQAPKWKGGQQQLFFLALFSGLIESTATGRVFWISEPTVGSSRAQNTSPREMSTVIFGTGRQASSHQMTHSGLDRPSALSLGPSTPLGERDQTPPLSDRVRTFADLWWVGFPPKACK